MSNPFHIFAALTTSVLSQVAVISHAETATAPINRVLSAASSPNCIVPDFSDVSRPTDTIAKSIYEEVAEWFERNEKDKKLVITALGNVEKLNVIITVSYCCWWATQCGLYI